MPLTHSSIILVGHPSLSIAGLRAYRPQGSRKEKQLAAERAQVLEPSLQELQNGGGPEKSASAGCVDFSFPPTKLSPGVAKPPLFLAPQKRTPTSTPDSAAGLKAEVRKYSTLPLQSLFSANTSLS